MLRLLFLCCCFPFSSLAYAQTDLQYLSSVLPLIQSHDLRGAETKLSEGLAQFPHSALLSNALGMVFEQEHRTKEAIGAYQLATEWLPNFTAAQIHLGCLLAQEGECSQAGPILITAAEATSDAGALSATGIGLAQCKDYTPAVAALSKAHSSNPQSGTITFNLALAQFKQGDTSSTLTTLDSAPAGTDQQRPEVLYLRGKALQALSKPGAAAAMSVACQEHPEEDFCGDAALELIREEQFLKAADLLDNAMRGLQSSAAVLSALGLAQFNLGRYSDAILSYSKAIELSPRLEAPREGLAFLLYITGDLERAKKVLEEAPANGSSNFYLSYLRALVLYRVGREQWSQSLLSLADALQRNATFGPAYFLRGKIRMEQGDLNSALADFQTSSKLDDTYALPYYKIAQIYRRQGRTEEAETAQRQFLALGGMREEDVLARQARNQLLAQSH